MLKTNAADYVITDESVTILYTDGTKEEITAGFEKSKVDEEAFAALFMPKRELQHKRTVPLRSSPLSII